jgi:hypothetical protein
MIIDGNILVQGIDKDFFQDKFEIFHTKYKKISCIISFNLLNEKYKISKVDRIDLTCLYNKNLIYKAYHKNYSTILDSNFLNQMNECQILFFSTLDRCCAIPLSISSQREYFYELVYFFKSFFENRKDIKNLFFSTTPHFPVDIILFYTAKYFSLNIIILSRTDFNNQFFFRNDWQNIHFFNNDILYNDKKFKIDTNMDSKFVQHGKNLNNLSISSLKRNVLDKNIFKKYFYLIKHSVHVFKSKNEYSSLFLNNNIDLPTIIKLHFKRYNENKILYKSYIKYSIKPDLTSDYLYFPLHFQPERTTDPEGMFFSNQLIALQLLRSTLPQNIKIFVKEHPRQFDPLIPDLRKLYSRSKLFYKKILNLPNTYLINIDTNSNDLIYHSKFVATITGSAGWEGALKGKPVFIFGRPWYASCDSCFIINDKNDIINALNKISNQNFRQNIENVKKFINNIEGKTFDAFIGNVYFDGDKHLYNNLIHSFANNLNKHLNSLNN